MKMLTGRQLKILDGNDAADPTGSPTRFQIAVAALVLNLGSVGHDEGTTY